MQEKHTGVRRFSFDQASAWVLSVTVLLGLVAFIPVAVIPFIYTKVSVLAMGGIIALALFILARLIRGNIIVPPVTLIGVLWILPAAYFLSALFSGVGLQQAFFGNQLEPDTLGFVVLMASLATLGALVFRKAEQYRAFYKVMAVGALLVIVGQVLILAVSKFSPQTLTATTNLVGSFTDLGMFLGLVVSIGLIALRFVKLSSVVKKAVYVAGGVSLLLLAVVNSPIVWVLVGLTALGLFIEAIMKRRADESDEDFAGVTQPEAERESAVAQSPDTRSLAAPLITLVFAIFFVIGGNTIGNALSQSLGANFLDVRPSWQSTFDVGSHTYAASPLFGSGPGTFGSSWLTFRERALNETVFWNVDFTSGIGYVPTSFVTTGLLGALAWIVFIGLFLWVGLRGILFKAPSDPFIRFISIASFVSFLYVLFLSVLSVPGPALLAIGFMSAGIFVSTLRHGAGRHEWGVIFSKNPRVGFVIVFVLTLLLLASVVAAFGVTTRYLAETSYLEGATALQQGNVDKARTSALASLSFSETDRAYQLIASAGLARMSKIAQDQSLAPAEAQAQFQEALSTSVEAALTATQKNPKNYQNWVLLGNVYQTVAPLGISGAYDSAKTAYLRAKELNPTSPSIPFTLAQLEIGDKKAEAAEEYLLEAIALKPNYTQAIFLLSQLKVSQGKAREALQAAEAAAYFTPNDPVVMFQVGILRSGTGDPQGAIVALSRAVSLNPQYANARFFLAVAYASAGQLPQALQELQAVAALSDTNAQAVAADIKTLEAGKNPFPASRLGALGIPQLPVEDSATGTR